MYSPSYHSLIFCLFSQQLYHSTPWDCRGLSEEEKGEHEEKEKEETELSVQATYMVLCYIKDDCVMSHKLEIG